MLDIGRLFNSQPVRGYGRDPNLDHMSEDYERAMHRGDDRAMDQITDMLGDRVQLGRRSEELFDALDRVGGSMRARRDSGANEIIQALRQAVAAEGDRGDGLRNTLSKQWNPELERKALDLADELRERGDHRGARAVEDGVGELRRIIDKGMKKGGRGNAEHLGDRMREHRDPDLDRAGRDFDRARERGNDRGMDEITDRIGKAVDWKDRDAEDLFHALDELGADARRAGRGKSNETIQMLRQAVAAEGNMRDGLKNILADEWNPELKREAMHMAGELRDRGRGRAAGLIEDAVKYLENIIEDEGLRRGGTGNGRHLEE
jgi:hypothetical protein